MAVNTYYFDGSGGISDPSDVWSDDANAFDGDDTTFASPFTNNVLIGYGTNSPTSGDSITQVRARIKRDDTEGYLDWVTLDAPSGGWSWTAVSNLESSTNYVGAANSYIQTDIYEDGDLDGTSLGTIGGETGSETNDLYIIQVEVTSEADTPSLTNITSLTGVTSIQL